MKKKIFSVLLAVVLMLSFSLVTAVPTLATDGGAILHPGYISGSVSVDGYNITRIMVKATDETKTYSATVGVNPPPSPSIDYTLTVEGGYNYYVVAWAEIVSTDPANPMDYTLAWLPEVGPYYVEVDQTVPDVDMSMTPAIVQGNISTGNAIDIISFFDLRARNMALGYFHPTLDSRTTASGLTAPGDTGRDYRLLLAPDLDYRLWGYVDINGIRYTVPAYDFTAPGAGETLTKDLPFVVNRATVSGTTRLTETGIDVDESNVLITATAYNPKRSISTKADPDTGAYTLDLTADIWYLYVKFPFVHTGVGLEGVSGFLQLPRTEVTLSPDESRTMDLIIEPGFITGTVSLTGAKTEYVGGWIQADSVYISGGKISSNINPENGKYMFVASPGSWKYGYWFLLVFNYYDESNNYIGRSDIWKHLSSDIYTVVSGETVPGLDVAYGTATVKLMYYVAGGGELSSPMLVASGPVIAQNVWGSNTKPTEGQAICTLIPGTYTISATAVVDGSRTSFGTFTVTVVEGDMVVIGGVAGPTLKVTSPTEGAVIPAPTVTVEGTATDDVGIESITINGENATFSSTGNPDDPNEVGFSHEVSLPDVGENAITVVAQDIDGMPEVTCSFKVIREVATTLTYTGDALAQVNTPAALAATLVDEENNPVSGADISFQVADQSCSALTGADGVASCDVTIGTAGVYEVTAEFAGDVSHQPSTATALLTVYDPEGGFVTGGGWIDSPQGAYTADPTLGGRANFGFVSKYKKGASTPTGQTEFQFKVADLNFHSDNYEWLVVAGARAQYKGTGTINGIGNYGFMLTAIDEKLTPSTDANMFRIKIWDKATDAVVYDNQMGAPDGGELVTVIGGGNIVIH